MTQPVPRATGASSDVSPTERIQQVRALAERVIATHLDPHAWTFAFDRARRRAGQCDYTARRITVSRFFAERHDDEQIEQVLLHEIAHALAGADAGHGRRWRTVAAEIGYTGGRTTALEIAPETAPWVGTCPAGHEHVRFRAPKSVSSCARCSRSFSFSNLIEWRRR